MPYDAHPKTLAWFERVFTSGCGDMRRRAVALLGDVDCPGRWQWLREAERDSDPRISATAVLTRSLLDGDPFGSEEDLFESDFAEGVHDPGLGWEWEYSFVICEGLYIPSAGWRVWTRDEDDDQARQLALLRATGGAPSSRERTPVMVDKRYVSRYTRSPRSTAEAMLWRRRGRPRLADGE